MKPRLHSPTALARRICVSYHPSRANDEARAVAVDGRGNVVLTGSSWNIYLGNYSIDYYHERLANFFRGYAQGLALDTNGNVVMTGGYSYTAKYAAANDALLWEKRDIGGRAVAVDGSGNVVMIAGSTAKYAAADGALLWEIRYNKGNDFPSSLALGPNGMVVITGSSYGDYATVVYREVLPPIAIALISTGVRLSFTGTPGLSYKIERAPAVTGPWTTLATPTAPLGGLIEHLDTNAPVGTAFYRTSLP